MYIARQYVRLDGKTIIPGEKIPEGISEETVGWLLKAEAIKEVASVPEEIRQEAPAADAVMQEPETEAETEPEPDEEEDSPEIDVMAGIVQAEEGEAPKNGSGQKKQRGRRKAT